MALSGIADWLETREFALAIAESAWLFPTIESIHVLSLALVFGTIATVDLRLMGFVRKETPFTEICTEMLPWTWGAFAIASISGLLMFASSASRYVELAPFLIKMGFLAMAALNMAAFHLTTYRSVNEWDSRPPPVSARIAGFCSIMMWTGVIFLGRWIGFV